MFVKSRDWRLSGIDALQFGGAESKGGVLADGSAGNELSNAEASELLLLVSKI